jgi:mycoredoxin
MERVRVQVYGAEWCPLSLGFRKYLEAQGIAFEWLEVERDPQAAAAATAMNGGKLKFPMVVVGEVGSYWKIEDQAAVLKNPKLAELTAALEQHGLM